MTDYPYEWYMHVNLVTLNGPFKGSVYNIDEENSFVFGTDPDCTIQVDDEAVSPFHFRIEVEQPVVRLIECSGIGGVFIKQKIHRWEHFSAPSAGRLDQPHSCCNTIILSNNERIRVVDYFFQIKIDRPPVCIECGMTLSGPQRAMSEFVGDIYHCPECDGINSETLECDEDFFELVKLVIPVLDKYYHAFAINYLLGIKARQVWLEGIYNNKEYVKTIVDYDITIVDYKKLLPYLTDE